MSYKNYKKIIVVLQVITKIFHFCFVEEYFDSHGYSVKSFKEWK